MARAEGINAKLVDVLREDIKALGEYDYVTAFEVLEHLPNPEVFALSGTGTWQTDSGDHP